MPSHRIEDRWKPVLLPHPGSGATKVTRTPLIDIVRCARCGGALREESVTLACGNCGQHYPVTDGIPQLFVPNEWGEGKLDVTDLVKEFYEETPFPNYDDSTAARACAARPGPACSPACWTSRSPRIAGARGRLRHRPADQFPRHGLAPPRHRRRPVHELAAAGEGLPRPLRRCQRRLRADEPVPPAVSDASFDLVISNGVLHHTADPAGGFRSILPLKPGGHIVIGLYNWLGRLPTLWRRRLIETFGDRMAALDSRLRGDALNTGRWAAWFRDQYKHPHESKHSMGEVLGWFKSNNVEFVSSVPSIGDVEFKDDEQLFARHGAGSSLARLSSEIEMLHFRRTRRRPLHHDRAEGEMSRARCSPI